MLPASIIGRLLAVLWFVACLGVLIFAYQQQHIHDMPVAFVWLVIFLTFPVGLAVSALAGVISGEISAQFGLAYHPFLDLIPFWVISVVAGYAQWFILLPRLVKKLWHARSNLP